MHSCTQKRPYLALQRQITLQLHQTWWVISLEVYLSLFVEKTGTCENKTIYGANFTKLSSFECAYETHINCIIITKITNFCDAGINSDLSIFKPDPLNWSKNYAKFYWQVKQNAKKITITALFENTWTSSNVKSIKLLWD